MLKKSKNEKNDSTVDSVPTFDGETPEDKETPEKMMQHSDSNKKQKTPQARYFYRQSEALVYIKKHGGLIFSRDVPKKIGAKLFFVLPSIDDIYDFIFAHPKIDRYFYEFLLPNKPSKLTFDLDLPRDKLKDGEDLVKTMDAMEKEFTGIVVQQLQDLHAHICTLVNSLTISLYTYSRY